MTDPATRRIQQIRQTDPLAAERYVRSIREQLAAYRLDVDELRKEYAPPSHGFDVYGRPKLT